jgi:hypothetical protein
MPEQLAKMDWTCGRCEVTASWMAGTERPELPANWSLIDGEPLCLGCRRERAAETALEALDDGAPALERQQSQSHARIEFEIQRDPDRPDNRIAKSCRTSVIAVRKARERLGLNARPPKPSDAADG